MKPKCPKCGGRLEAYSYYLAPTQEPWVFEVGCVKVNCNYTRRVSRAAIIRLAMEPKKPETCKWTRSETGYLRNTEGTTHFYGATSFCSDCGKPVEVVVND